MISVSSFADIVCSWRDVSKLLQSQVSSKMLIMESLFSSTALLYSNCDSKYCYIMTSYSISNIKQNQR